jgi:hypothetical protein
MRAAKSARVRLLPIFDFATRPPEILDSTCQAPTPLGCQMLLDG